MTTSYKLEAIKALKAAKKTSTRSRRGRGESTSRGRRDKAPG